MASPFVPVPMPLDRTLSGGSNKLRRAQRASSLGSVSRSSDSLSPSRKGRGRGVQGEGSHQQHQSRCLENGARSQTPSPPQSPVSVTRARVNGALEASVEYSSCPRATPDSLEGQQDAERPITPTLLGYEVMEERAKFTVYKLLVRKTQDESWVVFRRYADFSRLNDKLKEMFPCFRLSLPPKRWFKDNYELDFLEDRQLGLGAFLQNLVAHKDIANCLAVREFLCLDDPPGPFDSLEESRAFCETLEESNYRLQKELLEKQKEILSLRRRLEEREQAIMLLERHFNGECVSPLSPCVLSAQGSESSVDVDVESSNAEADQDMAAEDGGRCEVQPVRSSACWCAPSLSRSPPVIRITQFYQQP